MWSAEVYYLATRKLNVKFILLVRKCLQEAICIQSLSEFEHYKFEPMHFFQLNLLASLFNIICLYYYIHCNLLHYFF